LIKTWTAKTLVLSPLVELAWTQTQHTGMEQQHKGTKLKLFKCFSKCFGQHRTQGHPYKHQRIKEYKDTGDSFLDKTNMVHAH
jgi:hypothetical protein